MIVKNEEKYLSKCLKSVSTISNDIIIVDTGSTDNSKLIAQNFTSNLFDFDWCDDFSAARNYSLKHAKNPFILVIDADEELVNPNELLNTISGAKNNDGGFLIDVQSFTEKESSKDLFSSKIIRLFRNNDLFRYEGIIHEQIVNSIINNNYKIKDTDIKIYHKGYNLSPSEMSNKQKRNLNMLLKQEKTNPNDAYNLGQIARTYLAMEDLINSELYTKRALKYAKNNNVVKPQLLNYGAICAYKAGDKELAIQRSKNSLDLLQKQGFANYILGECYHDFGESQKAIFHYMELLDYNKNKSLESSVVGDYQLPKSQIYFRLGREFYILKEFSESEQYFIEGIRSNKKDLNCLVGLANLYNQLGRLEDSLSLLEDARNISSNKTEIDKYINQVKLKMKSADKSQIDNSNKLITLSMIVKNEEKMLRGCLESAKEIVDEIVIVDTGSTDNTKLIASEYGAKILDFKWVDDFAAARNHALKNSNGSWILYLDADERLKPLKKEKFREALKNLNENVGGLICTIESPHANLTGKKSDIHRGGYPRIFKNLGFPKVKFQGRVHEQISPSLKENGLSLVNSEIEIMHLGYDQSREVMEKKIQRNYKMLIQHVKEEPTNGYAWYQLGQTLGHMKLAKQAEETIRFAIQCGNLSDFIEASASASIAQFAGNRKDYNEALKWAEKSLNIVPNSLFAQNLKAYSLLHLGRFSESLKSFEKSLDLRKKFFESTPSSGYDIDIPIEVIERGIKYAKNKTIPKN